MILDKEGYGINITPVANNTDPNTVMCTAFYAIGEAIANRPSGSTSIGSLLSFDCGGAYVRQIYIDSTGKAWSRLSTDRATFGQWYALN